MIEDFEDEKVDQPDFGIRLKNLRRDHNLSQKDLADRIGRSEDLINVIERGRSWISRPTMRRLADAFHISEGSLLDFDGNRAFIESGGLKWRASRRPSHLIVRNQKVRFRTSSK